MGGKKKTGLSDVFRLIAEVKQNYPDLKDLATTIFGPKVDPEELFNKAVVYVKQALYNDPYYIVGISRDDTKELAKDVFKAKAKHYHPDTGGDHKKFTRLNNAWGRIKQERDW